MRAHMPIQELLAPSLAFHLFVTDIGTESKLLCEVLMRSKLLTKGGEEDMENMYRASSL